MELRPQPSLYQLEGSSPTERTIGDNGPEKDDKRAEPNVKTKSEMNLPGLSTEHPLITL